MKIKKVLSQHRRDYTALMECEFCGHQQQDSGYDDRNYHDNVIPNQKCKSCNKSTVSEGGTPDKTATRYSEHQVV